MTGEILKRHKHVITAIMRTAGRGTFSENVLVKVDCAWQETLIDALKRYDIVIITFSGHIASMGNPFE